MPWTSFDTALGRCGIAWSEAGVTRFQLPEGTAAETETRLRTKARTRADEPRARKPPPWIASAIAMVEAHLAGEPQDFAGVPIDLAGVPPFPAEVYRALRAVPAGTTVSYTELAKLTGSPGAARAVGQAMATNPIPLIVACHRVLAAGGKPGGFSAYGGLVTKERMLRLEGWAPEPSPLLLAPLFAAASGSVLPFDAAAALAHLGAADERLAEHIGKVGAFGLELKQTEGLFAALAESIVYQQLNGKAAATIFARVRALFPRGRLDPKALLGMGDDLLRGAGLSRGKLAALRDLSARVAAAELPTLAQLQRMDDDAIVESLTAVRGIGRWTVEMLLIFRLGRPDVLPVADYGIKKGYARLFHRGRKKDELPTDADLRARGERWRPFRSVASWYLWRAVDPGF